MFKKKCDLLRKKENSTSTFYFFHENVLYLATPPRMIYKKKCDFRKIKKKIKTFYFFLNEVKFGIGECQLKFCLVQRKDDEIQKDKRF